MSLEEGTLSRSTARKLEMGSATYQPSRLHQFAHGNRPGLGSVTENLVQQVRLDHQIDQWLQFLNCFEAHFGPASP